MFKLAWIWVLLVLPLPLLVTWLIPRVKEAPVSALRVPFYASLTTAESGQSTRLIDWIRVLAILTWLLLVLAASRPQWVGEPISIPVTGRDLLLAVDISESMRFQDMELGGELVSRIGVVKHVAGDFIRRREGDRIGLVLFGTRAYLQTPLTFDRDTVSTLLNEAELGIAGKRTAIGDAIGLAVKRLRETENSERVVVLLTDGANTTGEIEPLRAADLAARAGLTIYTIGVGAEQLTVTDFFGSRRINPSSDLDEETLQSIADKTGGRYFRARDTESLEEIYKILDTLEPVASDDKTLRPVSELFTWPLALALLLTGMIVLLGYKQPVLNQTVANA